MPTKRPSVAERARLFAAGRAGGRRVFSRRRAGVRARRGGAAVRAARGRARARRGAWRRHSRGGERRRADRHRRRRRYGGRNPRRPSHEVVATDAKRRWIDQVALGPDGIVAWSAGKEAFVHARSGEPRARRGALHGRAGSPSRPRACGSPSPITTVRRCGFRTPRRSRSGSNGRARMLPRASAPTGASSSPRCRSRRCTAGASPTASTCGCRATRRKCARWHGARAARRSRRQARAS